MAGSRQPRILRALLAAILVATAALASDLTPVRVTLSETLSHAPLYIADEEGFFTDEGLELVGMTFRRTAAALPGLAGGDLDVYIGVSSPSNLNVIARSNDVKFVMARTEMRSEGCAAYSMMANRELVESGRLRTPADLKGLRIGTERTSSNFFIINMLLRSGGLTVDDVSTEYIPPALKPEGFQRDIIDVTTSSEPYLTRMIDAGSAVRWIPFNDVVPGYQYGYMLFGPTLLKDNREKGRRFMRAYLRAVRQYNREGKSERHLEILSARLRLDTDFLKRTCWPYHANDGRIDIELLDRYQEWALAEGFVDRTLTSDELWDRGFVDHANRVLDGAE